MIIGVLLVQAVAFAILSAIVASNKNRNPAGWGVLGLLFGLFGFIAAIAVGKAEDTERVSCRRSSGRRQPSRKKTSSSEKQRQKSSTQEFDPDEHEKKCPDCAEYIKLEARVCKHCGHEFSDEEVERQIEERRGDIVGELDEEEKKSETVDLVDLTKSQKYYLRTHEFKEDGQECEKCGVSKSYIVKNRYKCRYSEH